MYSGLVPALSVPNDVIGRFEAHVHRAPSGPYATRPLPYRLLRPAAGPGTLLPLVLFLHGAGERGDDNTAQLRYLPQWLCAPPLSTAYPSILIVPQLPGMRRWGSVHWSVGKRVYSETPSAELLAVRAILDHVLDTSPADPDRVYLTGLSMGGFGAWEMASRWPERFAALAPICGGGDVTRVAPLAGLPVWAWHGGADDVVAPERSREMIAALAAAGGRPRYTELPGVGHDAWTPAYCDKDGLLQWMFAQRRGL